MWTEVWKLHLSTFKEGDMEGEDYPGKFNGVVTEQELKEKESQPWTHKMK
jgi:hypothetical protein